MTGFGSPLPQPPGQPLGQSGGLGNRMPPNAMANRRPAYPTGLKAQKPAPNPVGVKPPVFPAATPQGMHQAAQQAMKSAGDTDADTQNDRMAVLYGIGGGDYGPDVAALFGKEGADEAGDMAFLDLMVGRGAAGLSPPSASAVFPWDVLTKAAANGVAAAASMPPQPPPGTAPTPPAAGGPMGAAPMAPGAPPMLGAAPAPGGPMGGPPMPPPPGMPGGNPRVQMPDLASDLVSQGKDQPTTVGESSKMQNLALKPKPVGQVQGRNRMGTGGRMRLKTANSVIEKVALPIFPGSPTTLTTRPTRDREELMARSVGDPRKLSIEAAGLGGAETGSTMGGLYGAYKGRQLAHGIFDKATGQTPKTATRGAKGLIDMITKNPRAGGAGRLLAVLGGAGTLGAAGSLLGGGLGDRIGRGVAESSLPPMPTSGQLLKGGSDSWLEKLAIFGNMGRALGRVGSGYKSIAVPKENFIPKPRAALPPQPPLYQQIRGVMQQRQQPYGPWGRTPFNGWNKLSGDYTFSGEDCPKCGVSMEGDSYSGKCNSCGHKWGEKKAVVLAGLGAGIGGLIGGAEGAAIGGTAGASAGLGSNLPLLAAAIHPRLRGKMAQTFAKGRANPVGKVGPMLGGRVQGVKEVSKATVKDPTLQKLYAAGMLGGGTVGGITANQQLKKASVGPRAVFGLGRWAKIDPERLGKAYRSMSKSIHPDHNPGDPAAAERFMKLTDAFEKLTGKQKFNAPLLTREGVKQNAVPLAAAGSGVGLGGGLAYAVKNQKPQVEEPMPKQAAHNGDLKGPIVASASGESKGLSFADAGPVRHGKDAWDDVSKYFKGHSKRTDQPNPFEGKHAADGWLVRLFGLKSAADLTAALRTDVPTPMPGGGGVPLPKPKMPPPVSPMYGTAQATGNPMKVAAASPEWLKALGGGVSSLFRSPGAVAREAGQAVRSRHGVRQMRLDGRVDMADSKLRGAVEKARANAPAAAKVEQAKRIQDRLLKREMALPGDEFGPRPGAAFFDPSAMNHPLVKRRLAVGRIGAKHQAELDKQVAERTQRFAKRLDAAKGAAKTMGDRVDRVATGRSNAAYNKQLGKQVLAGTGVLGATGAGIYGASGSSPGPQQPPQPYDGRPKAAADDLPMPPSGVSAQGIVGAGLTAGGLGLAGLGGLANKGATKLKEVLNHHLPVNPNLGAGLRGFQDAIKGAKTPGQKMTAYIGHGHDLVKGNIMGKTTGMDVAGKVYNNPLHKAMFGDQWGSGKKEHFDAFRKSPLAAQAQVIKEMHGNNVDKFLTPRLRAGYDAAEAAIPKHLRGKNWWDRAGVKDVVQPKYDAADAAKKKIMAGVEHSGGGTQGAFMNEAYRTVRKNDPKLFAEMRLAGVRSAKDMEKLTPDMQKKIIALFGEKSDVGQRTAREFQAVWRPALTKYPGAARKVEQAANVLHGADKALPRIAKGGKLAAIGGLGTAALGLGTMATAGPGEEERKQYGEQLMAKLEQRQQMRDVARRAAEGSKYANDGWLEKLAGGADAAARGIFGRLFGGGAAKAAPGVAGKAAPSVMGQVGRQALPMVPGAIGGAMTAESHGLDPWAGAATGAAAFNPWLRGLAARNAGRGAMMPVHGIRGAIGGNFAGSMVDTTAGAFGYDTGGRFARMGTYAGGGLGTARGAGAMGAANPLTRSWGKPLHQWTGKAMNQVDDFSRGAFDPIVGGFKRGARWLTGGRAFAAPAAGTRAAATAAKAMPSVGRRLGQTAMGATLVGTAGGMGMDYLDNKFNQKAQETFESGLGALDEYADQKFQQYAQQAPRMIGQGLVNSVADPILGAMGMNTAAMHPMQKAMMMGGAGLGAYGAMTGNPWAMGAGALGAGAGYMTNRYNPLSGGYDQGGGYGGGYSSDRNELAHQQQIQQQPQRATGGWM